MTDIIQLQCSCKSVKGELQLVPKHTIHVHCYCCDCKTVAEYLSSNKSLDNNDASQLLQTYPQYLSITQGLEHVSCLKVTEKGKLRWYTRCCNTSIGNTMDSYKVPFLGVSTDFMNFENDQEKSKCLGPVYMKAFGKYIEGEKPNDVSDTFPLSYTPKLMTFMMKGMILKKNKPSVFFESKKAIKPAKLL